MVCQTPSPDREVGAYCRGITNEVVPNGGRRASRRLHAVRAVSLVIPGLTPDCQQEASRGARERSGRSFSSRSWRPLSTTLASITPYLQEVCCGRPSPERAPI